MSFQPYDLLEDRTIQPDQFWSLVSKDEHFYRLLRAYNTIGKILHKEHVQEECLFDLTDLKRERLQLRDEMYSALRHH